jgi:SRSO17 transposase
VEFQLVASVLKIGILDPWTMSQKVSQKPQVRWFENQLVEAIPIQIEGVGMGLRERKSVELRFRGYVEGLVRVIGHADRAGPLRDYCTGLVAASGRKSVEPMAAITAPERTAAQHQSLLHFIGQGAWSDGAVLAKVREMVLPRIERHGAIKAWIVDDTGFPKKGEHSVGVAHQ